MKSLRLAALALTLSGSVAALAFAAGKPSKPHPMPAPAATAPAPVDPAYMWDLSDLYPSAEAWTAERDRTKALAEKLDSYKGTLGKSAKDLLAAMSAISDVQRSAVRLSAYAGLKADEDVRIAQNQERQQLASALFTLFNEKTAWFTPELLAVGADKIKKFETQEPELARRFGFQLDNQLRFAPHTLSPETEATLASAGDVFSQPNAIYSVLANGEVPFPTVKLSTGETVTIGQGTYAKYRQLPNRADRKAVFDTFWGMWKKYEGTLGATLTTQVMQEVFNAKVRHYPNSLAAATFADNMPEAVYRQLVAQANAGLPTFHRYLKLRKKLLGITDNLAYYDIYPTMFKLEKPLHFSVADSERIGLDVTAAYGPEYVDRLKKGFAGRWMDVLPREGKAGGAYMQGSAYDVHPYLHLNHNDDYNALSTFVHEWGHAVHTLLTHESQPYENSNYSTFTAETASITNEMLLNDYMVAHAQTDQEKLYYLGELLELLRATFFRQTMFAEFQLALHEEVEAGHALSGKHISEIYCGLLKKYHGEASGVMTIDPAYCTEWEFIPHFYYGFYVWQYATSMAGAAIFAEDIEHGGKAGQDRFISLLKAGGSDYPYNLYKKAGLDMATPAPYEALIARMNRTMDQIDALEAKRGK
ncbi:MAG: oligoendopeptidase F family protein [Alphaproteobacteria bacterium]|nr:oligoendopeptidase F family protein [Alphaproteobacteria bacterium]MBV9420686.1 oligoendopeptidase F family protein [Alphaproteobacteria bacterium]MBV9539909.1 oligoendopeptidase F family protein [Alphaproteobacteria bacterium]